MEGSSEGGRHGEYASGEKLPHIGSIFQRGKHENQYRVHGWEGLVSYYDVKDANKRYEWCLENIDAYNDVFTKVNWFAAANDYIDDLKNAAEREGLGKRNKDILQTEKLLKSMMSVTVAARGMQFANGSASGYLQFVSAGAELNVSDELSREFMLAGKPDKLNTVIEDPLIRPFYQMVLKDAGVTVENEWKQEKTGERTKNIPSFIIVNDKDVAKNGRFAEYLKNNAEKGGVNGYVDMLVDQYVGTVRVGPERKPVSEKVLRGAIKLACDAFLVDKYTRWEYMIDPKADLKLAPVGDFKGDPFRHTIEPSYLPRRVKSMYTGNSAAVLDLMDLAFNPADVFSGDPILKAAAVQASAVEGLSKWYRLNDAISKFLGDSRGSALPMWNDKVLGEELPGIAKNLDQVYGGVKDGNTPVGKHLVALMVARVLHTKALALTLETEKPNWRDYMKAIFGADIASSRPFYKIEQSLWGENLDSTSGWLKSLAVGGTNLVFENNRYGVHKHLQDTYNLLDSNDSDPRSQKSMDSARKLRFLFKSIEEIQKIFIRGR